jgi:hypothetical protein
MADDKKQQVEELTKELDLLEDSLNNIYSTLNTQMQGVLSNLTTDAGAFIDKFEKGQNITAGLTAKMVEVQKKTNRLSLDRLDLEKQLANAVTNRDRRQQTILTNQIYQNKLALNQLESTQTLLNKLNQQVEAENKITKELKEQNTLTGVIDAKYKSISTSLEKFFSVANAIKMIGDGLTQANNNSVWISKNLGYGAANAYKMNMGMQAMSLTSDATNLTMKSMGTAMVQLADATGGVADYNKDVLETQVMLTRQLGLSGEEAAGIYKLGVLNNQTSEQTNKQMLRTFATTRNAVGGSISFQKAMAESAKVSGQLASNLQNNPGLITAAVVKMQALGTSLEQTKNQGEKLLNFASSIESELKAELIVGKELNLERARAAALAGDQVTLAQELNKNVGSLADFNKMNVIQQQALAEAVGLTADQLADQLRKQEVAVKQGKSLAQVNADELEAAEKRKTIQEKFNNFVEKLQDLVGSIGTAIEPFVAALTWILDHTWAVYTVLGLWIVRAALLGNTFKGILGSIVDIGKNIGNKILGKTAAPTTPAPATPTTPAASGGGMGGFLKGISATDMIKGAAAILILSAALFVAAKAFQEFTNVGLKDMAKAGIALLGLAGIAILLGKAKGPILEGSIAIAILGAGLIPLAFALRIATPAIEAFGNVITKVFTGLATVITAAAGGIATIFGSLQNVDVTKLLAIGPALTMIGIGLAALGAGNVIAAIGNFLGGDPIKKIERLAEAGTGLQNAATGLQAMAGALTQVASALASIDVSKLNALSDFTTSSAISGAVNGITSLITTPVKAIGSMLGGTNSNDNTGMVTAINEVRDAVNKLYAKNTDIYLDSKKITTAGVQNSYGSA